MAQDDIVRSAEKEVVEAAKEWSRTVQTAGRKLTPPEQRLRQAIFMLQKARGITGRYSIVAPEETEEEGG